jgi:hypothetical protein
MSKDRRAVKSCSAGALLPHSPYIWRDTESNGIRLEGRKIHMKPDRTVVTLVTLIFGSRD